MAVDVKRGHIVWVDFGPVRGKCKAGLHPAVVVQNDKGNHFSPMTIVVPLTDQRQHKALPVQVLLTSAETGACNLLRTSFRFSSLAVCDISVYAYVIWSPTWKTRPNVAWNARGRPSWGNWPLGRGSCGGPWSS
ncbi:MAG: type II toxin-antitoxin system PemK/MazF family toxin [Planctomycetes bacterium]|nr:type II toxin-antitoxin system PemK/MazF family toxin [Planctomycetota bacterium]